MALFLGQLLGEPALLAQRGELRGQFDRNRRRGKPTDVFRAIKAPGNEQERIRATRRITKPKKLVRPPLASAAMSAFGLASCWSRKEDVRYAALRREGAASRLATTSRAGARPSIKVTTASTSGMAISFRRARSARTGAVNAPSATVARPLRAWAALWPSPSALPSEKLRLDTDEQVRTRSPSPESPESVSACAPSASPNRCISAKPRLISAARAFCPRPSPSTTPQAIASTFLTAPPISAPVTSAEK
jgi:hypothetical protein